MGDAPPDIRCPPPGPVSRSWTARAGKVRAPMGPIVLPGPSSGIVYASGEGSNVIDVDGNRYVDLAAGFGALLLGHAPAVVIDAVKRQSERLLLALGDVFSSDATITLQERLSSLYPKPGARVILGQSGADAVTAALKTAVLATDRAGIVAFAGAYHGLSYAPLAACGLRPSYREPFARQLNAEVTFIDYPMDAQTAARALSAAERALSTFTVGAVLVEPVLGRGGVVVPPSRFLPELSRMTQSAGALLVADEIWTGLGRSGALLSSVANGAVPDLICLGKGLGAGLPISACIGSEACMQTWEREEEVVHTSTFAGAPLACAAALAFLDALESARLLERSSRLGADFISRLRKALDGAPSVVAVRGAGMMIGIELTEPGAAALAQKKLLERGYIVSTGGGRRETIVLTPALTISAALLEGFVEVLREALA